MSQGRIAQSLVCLTGESEALGSASGLALTLLEIDHEIFFMVIFSLPLIQEGQFSVSGERLGI